MLRALGGFAAVGCAGGGYYYYQQHRPPPVDSALQPNKSLTCKLLDVEKLTTDTSRFR